MFDIKIFLITHFYNPELSEFERLHGGLQNRESQNVKPDPFSITFVYIKIFLITHFYKPELSEFERLHGGLQNRESQNVKPDPIMTCRGASRIKI